MLRSLFTVLSSPGLYYCHNTVAEYDYNKYNGGIILWAIYEPMIYTAPHLMCLMRAEPLRGQVGGGLALEIKTFWALWNGIEQLGECHLELKKFDSPLWYSPPSASTPLLGPLSVSPSDSTPSAQEGGGGGGGSTVMLLYRTAPLPPSSAVK